MCEKYTCNDVENPVLIIATSWLAKKTEVRMHFSESIVPPFVNLWAFFEGGCTNETWAKLDNKTKAEWICTATAADYRESIAGCCETAVEGKVLFPEIEFKGNEKNCAIFMIDPAKEMELGF